MSKYIDADAFKKRIIPHSIYDSDVVREAIDLEPSIDIVFCEDCRDCVEKGVGVDCPSGYGYLYCRRKKSTVNEDDHCSWGERKSE